MNGSRWRALTLAFVIVAPRVGAEPAPVSLRSLLDEMTDRDRLARWPQPLYASREFTSYDRASISPDKPGWFANHDSANYLRTEQNRGRTEFVMMDADGPGAIVCFFKASSDPVATVRIYLDGAAEPAIEENLRYLLGGGTETPQEHKFPEKRVPSFRADEAHFLGGFGTVKAPLAGVQSLGCNLYLPIPYVRHCKVTYDRPGRCYYRINYRTFAPSTPVESFSLAGLKESAGDVERARQALEHPDATIGSPLASVAAKIQALSPGASLATDLDGPGVVRHLALRVKATNLAQALRSTLLSITFDGAQTVWCPVGDFFGSGIGVHACQNWACSVGADGTMRCDWVMPFRRSCRIALTNSGSDRIEATLGDVAHGPWSWDDRSMYFHATWRQQYPIRTKAADGTMDWNYVEATGRGVYVGDTLVVHNGADSWWGEGDEKIYVDGESFPSHFGTGTEDYYGYSRGGKDSAYFQAPFVCHAQIEGDHHPGYSAMTRIRALDAIPFAKRLKFDMEIWHWKKTNMAYAATTYWYALPGAGSNRLPDPIEAQRSIVSDDN